MADDPNDPVDPFENMPGPKSRHTDPSTSKNAKQFHLNEDRKAVLRVHARHPAGLTDYDLAHIMGRQFNSVNVRRGELRDWELIVDTGLKRPAPSGSSCIVWRITDLGVEWVRILDRKEVFG